MKKLELVCIALVVGLTLTVRLENLVKVKRLGAYRVPTVILPVSICFTCS